MTNPTSDFKLPVESTPGRVALLVGIGGLALSVIGWIVDTKQFYFSWLTAFTFWTSIALGGLFFSMLHHLTGATWSVVLRRFSESAMMVIPLLALFFVPILFGLHDLYHWTHADVVAHDRILQAKAGYLNIPFFLVRAAAYFIVWIVLGRLLYKTSLRQDAEGSQSLADRMRRMSAPGMLLFALTLTYAAFDWLMSLDPHWYSTIFGVYIFVGSFLGILAFMTLAALHLREKGILADTITVEHYHDLGKLMFAFTVFWAYIAFSQYFLIWYGNIPEEIAFYIHRWDGSWKGVSLLIIFAHFVLPFLILMMRRVKRNFRALKFMGVWFLTVHLIDVYWIVQPNLHKHGMHFSSLWIDISALVGIGGVFIWFFWRQLASQSLVPTKDPKFAKSLHFVNS